MAESIRRKNDQRKKQFQQFEEYFATNESFNIDLTNSILQETPFNIVQKLKNDQLSAVQVLHAFQYKALQVTRKLNCITEFIPEAQNWAEKCDLIAPEKRRLLHGLPVSIKESFFVQGTDATIGVAKHLYNPSSEHAIVVEILIQEGAIPFCKTNVPQSLNSTCCSNPVYGLTVNPFDHTRTPGGSSGGEAALIAAGGSLVGLGTDLAGSCRKPANFCGLFGLKFTSKRISRNGTRVTCPVFLGMASCIGLIGKDGYITSLVAQVLINSQEMNLKDWTVSPGPWNEVLFKTQRPLKFGYWIDAEVCPCTPGVKRAVEEAKKALEDMGHTVVPFEYMDSKVMFSDSIKMLFADNGHYFGKLMEGEIIDDSITKEILPSWTNKFLTFILGLDNCHTVYRLYEAIKRKSTTVQAINDQMDKLNIDVLLSPGYMMPAPKHFTLAEFPTLPAYFYNCFANYCDFASGVVPVTRQSEQDEKNLIENYPENNRIQKIVKDATKGAIGMPIGVMLTARSFQEELVLKCMQDLEAVFKTP